MSLETRFSVFDADSYSAALYEAEPDVGHSVCAPPLYGRGWHASLAAGWRLQESVRLNATASVIAWDWKPGVSSLSGPGSTFSAGIQATIVM